MDENENKSANKSDWLRKNWMQLITLALCAVLVWKVENQQSIIETLQGTAGYQTSILDKMQISVDNISKRVADSVREANEPVADCSMTYAGQDLENRALLADLTVTLRQWSADTSVTLELTSNGETQRLPAAGGDGVYTASIPLTDIQNLSLAAAVETGGVTTRQELDSPAYLLPYRAGDWGGSAFEGLENDVLTLSQDVYVAIWDQNYEAVQVNDPVFRVERNGTPVWEQPAVYSDGWYYLSDPAADTDPVEIPGSVSDAFQLVFACTDDSGLGYEFCYSTLEFRGSDYMSEEIALTEAPTLVWPE